MRAAKMYLNISHTWFLNDGLYAGRSLDAGLVDINGPLRWLVEGLAVSSTVALGGLLGLLVAGLVLLLSQVPVHPLRAVFTALLCFTAVKIRADYPDDDPAMIRVRVQLIGHARINM